VSGTLRNVRVPQLEAVPGLAHGFEQRLGPPGWETRQGGRDRVASCLSALGRLFFMTQVHGARALRAPWEGAPDADAAISEAPGVLVAVETADCLPILLVDPQRRAVAAVHAGWRGTVAGAAASAVKELRAAGSRPGDVFAAVGPGIGPCCYEVGEDVRGAFGPGAKAFFRPGPNGRPHLDLRAVNQDQLQRAGILPERIHHVADCTFCHPDLYHSYRREGSGGGRMVSFVGFRLV
jgi:YfiH family protein